MSTMRKMKREVARHRMQLMGFRRVNRRLKAHWRELGSPDYVKKLQSKYENKKEEVLQ